MKKIVSLALAAASVFAASAANLEGSISTNETYGMAYPGLVEIDINGDGILDLIFSGQLRDNSIATYQAVWNSTTNSYDISDFPYYFGVRPQFVVWDFDGDGLSDFVVASQTGLNDNAKLGMFKNNGDGTFSQQAMSIVDETGNTIDRWEARNIDLGDFNSDGLMDIVCIGWQNDANNVRQHNNQVLINQGDFSFKSILTDLIKANGNPYEFALSTIVVADLNNDGYADFLCQGNVDNSDSDKPSKNGNIMGRSFNAYLNAGPTSDGDVEFIDLGLANGVSHYYGNGSIHVADFNNDGTPDIFVGGETPNDGRGNNDWDYLWQLLNGTITTDGVSYTDVTSNQLFSYKNIKPLNTTNGTRCIDYNGNGMYDLFIPGWCTSMLDGTNNTQAGWFFPNDNGNFTDYLRVPGASELSVFFMENGVSGARNYGYLGQTWDNTFFSASGRLMVSTVNPYEKPARPDAPVNLQVSVEGSAVNLSWSAAETSNNNVTYEYYIRNTGTNKFYTGTTAFVGGEKDGVRTTLAQGRAFMNKQFRLVDLPDGNYEWGVQTVNAALEGSTFAKGANFTIGSSFVNDIIDSSATVVATEFYDLVGRKLVKTPTSGIVIKKEIMSDGTCKSCKVVL